MQNEIWKDIPGYDGIYQVSNHGRVRSYTGHHNVRERYLIVSKSRGYRSVFLCKNGTTKCYTIHRLVAILFVQNPHNYKCVNHKNEIKTDNRADNLEWCTQAYNNRYGTARKRGAEKKSKPLRCIENGRIFKNGKEAGEEMGLSYSCIMKCCNKIRNSCEGYHFEFV